MITDLSRVIGANIKLARMEKGMKADVLAKVFKKTKQSISQLENGEVDIKISKLEKIASALEVDVCALVCPHIYHSLEEFNDRISNYRSIVINADVIERLITNVQELNEKIVRLESK